MIYAYMIGVACILVGITYSPLMVILGIIAIVLTAAEENNSN